MDGKVITMSEVGSPVFLDYYDSRNVKQEWEMIPSYEDNDSEYTISNRFEELRLDLLSPFLYAAQPTVGVQVLDPVIERATQSWTVKFETVFDQNTSD